MNVVEVEVEGKAGTLVFTCQNPNDAEILALMAIRRAPEPPPSVRVLIDGFPAYVTGTAVEV